MKRAPRWDVHFKGEHRKAIDRVQCRFRYHVRTRCHPQGRIHRESCGFCAAPYAEAHHVDYAHPFRVVWACVSCHRKIEHGSLRIRQKHVWDYSSVVRRRP